MVSLLRKVTQIREIVRNVRGMPFPISSKSPSRSKSKKKEKILLKTGAIAFKTYHPIRLIHFLGV